MTSASVVCLAALVAAMILLWGVSLLVKDASIVDIFWGLGFVLAAWVSAAFAAQPTIRASLVPWLVTMWGVRLAAHLAIRNLGKPEDYRYRSMREKYGPRFPLVSLGIVFLLQGALIWIVSLPVQAAVSSGADRTWSWTDVSALALVIVGLFFETTADVQLARFKRDPANAGRVMDRGLWRYSRHPNYFGDAVTWWGFGLFGVAAGAPWTIAGSIVMTVLLLKVSGVSLLEATIGDRRPAYRDYVARTSAFVPWRPKQD